MKKRRFEPVRYMFWTLVFSLSLTGKGYCWLGGWDYRREVTIDNTANSNTLSDYQVSISIDLTNLVAGAKLQSDGADIRMLDSDDKTLINYFIQSVESNKVWVNVPSIPSNTAKIVYIYYGNSEVPSLSSFNDTFTKDYGETGLQLLYHMDEGAGTSVADASGNTNNGTIPTASDVTVTDEEFTSATNVWVNLQRREIYSNSESITDTNNAVTYTNGTDYEMDYPEGKIKVLNAGSMADNTKYYADYTFDNSGATWLGSDGGHWGGETGITFSSGNCLTFDGRDDYVYIGKAMSAYNITSEYSFEAWLKAKVDPTGVAQCIISSDYRSHSIFLYNTAMCIDNRVNFIEGANRAYLAAITKGVWQHAVLTAKSNVGASFYLNGEFMGSLNVTSALKDLHLTVGIGVKGVQNVEYANAVIDEVRIYNRVLPAEEIKCHCQRRRYTNPEPSTLLGEEEKVVRGTTMLIK